MLDDASVEPIASLRSDGLTRYCFGNRWQFAIECEVQDCERDPWGTLEPYGSFWMWVGGQPVGNTDAAEQLQLAFARLAESVRHSDERPDTRFSGISNVDKLDLVGWVTFGEDDEFDAKRWQSEDPEHLRKAGLSEYEVIPRGDSPWCDGWEAILVEEDATETFIWRRRLNGVSDAQDFSVPRGTFDRVSRAACKWFEPIRGERIRPELRDPRDGVRLVRRIVEPAE
jgi:hypothetical protein